MMNASRNTINADVNYWYSRLEDEFKTVSKDNMKGDIVKMF